MATVDCDTIKGTLRGLIRNQLLTLREDLKKEGTIAPAALDAAINSKLLTSRAVKITDILVEGLFPTQACGTGTMAKKAAKKAAKPAAKKAAKAAPKKAPKKK